MVGLSGFDPHDSGDEQDHNRWAEQPAHAPGVIAADTAVPLRQLFVVVVLLGETSPEVFLPSGSGRLLGAIFGTWLRHGGGLDERWIEQRLKRVIAAAPESVGPSPAPAPTRDTVATHDCSPKLPETSEHVVLPPPRSRASCYRPAVPVPSLHALAPTRVVEAVRVRLVHPLLHAAATAAVGVAREALRWAYIGAADGHRLGFAAFGERSMIQQPHATLLGVERITIGADTLISAGASLAAAPEDGYRGGTTPMIEIGSRVWAAQGLSVVAHRHIEIGDDVWLGPGVHITDADHDPSDPTVPIGLRMERAQPVRIGDGSWLGTGVVVLPGVTIGDHVTVGANSVVCDDLPSYTVAVGAPARVVRQLHDASPLVTVADDDDDEPGADVVALRSNRT